MSEDLRHRKANWTVPRNLDGTVSLAGASFAVLMDIRESLQTLERLALCPRIPGALQVALDFGKEARRKKRAAAKRRKAKR